MKVDFASILSSSEFDSLDFHDSRHLSHQDKINVAQCVRNILSLLLEDIGYQHHCRPVDKALRQSLQAWSDANLLHLFPGKGQVLQAILDTSVRFTEYSYTLCQHETKLVMAIVTAIFIASDDDEILNPDQRDSLSYFSFNYWQNLPEMNDWCKVLANGLRMSAEYFGSQDPLVGSLVANKYSSFIDACAQEIRLEYELPLHLGNHGLSHTLSEGCSVESFPTYFRDSGGAPLVFIAPIFKISRNEEVPIRFWITVIPDLIKFINYTNDLLSCPKELLAGETWNYLSMKTQANRQAGRLTRYKSKQNKFWTFRDTLCETLEDMQRTTMALDQAFTRCIGTEDPEMPTSADDVSGSAKGEKNQVQNIQLAAQLWTSFKHGHISSHMNCSRYGLERMPFEGYTHEREISLLSKYKHLWGILLALAVSLILTTVKFGSTILSSWPHDLSPQTILGLEYT